MKTFTEDTLRDAREKLLTRAALLRDRVTRVRSDLKREQDPLPLDAPDAASARENDEVLQAVERAASSEIARIDTALERMEEGTFGLCEVCGQQIEAARFVSVPEATRCGACERAG
jgi:RNA polymerase-binding transcription factor DksA